MWILFSPNQQYQLRWQELHLDGRLCKNILAVGVPGGINGILQSTSNVILQSTVNTFGKEVIAGTAAALLAAVLFLPQTARAVSARSAVVQDAVSGRILYEKDADRQSLIASTTKIMTALIVCQQCNVLDRMRIPAQAVGIEGSYM